MLEIKIILMFGVPGFIICLVLDIVTKKMKEKKPMPWYTYALGVIAIIGLLYAIGTLGQLARYEMSQTELPHQSSPAK